jgi:adenylate kinase
MNPQPDRMAWFRGGDACGEVPFRDRSYRFVLLGPPGVGKGTQAALLCQALGACPLSTGDLFRAAQHDAEPSSALRTALEAMRRGELVPDEVVVATVRERANCLACRRGFVLDGFPRTTGQAEALHALLDEQGMALDAVVSYELPLETVVARLSGRRTCPACKAIYHLTNQPPRSPGVCDRCHGRLVQREDDRPESIRVRMRAYQEDTQPLAEYYRRAGKLLAVEAAGRPEEVLERTLRALHEHLAPGQPALVPTGKFAKA